MIRPLRLKENFPWKEVVEAADRHGLDPYLVAAVCLRESNGNTWAIRVEFEREKEGMSWWNRWRYLLDPLKYAREILSTTETEIIAQSTSFGLLQVMGTVAREYGFKGWLTQLCEPSVGLEFGCRHLSAKVKKYGLEDGISAYNAGSPTNQNHSYVEWILNKRDQLKKELSDAQGSPGSNPR